MAWAASAVKARSIAKPPARGPLRDAGRDVRLAPLFVTGSDGVMDVIFGPVLRLLLMIIQLYIWIVVIGVVLNWLVAFGVVNTSNRFVYMVGDFIHRITEPLLGRIRNVIPNVGNFDISPIILIFALILLQDFLITIASKFAH